MELRHLGCLTGRWKDGKGSVYQVELDAHGCSCSVTTFRPNGEERHTNNLIQFWKGIIYWGRNYKLQGCLVGAQQIRWASFNRRDFVWSRDARPHQPARQISWVQLGDPEPEQSATAEGKRNAYIKQNEKVVGASSASGSQAHGSGHIDSSFLVDSFRDATLMDEPQPFGLIPSRCLAAEEFECKSVLVTHVQKHDSQGCAVVTIIDTIDIDYLISQSTTLQLCGANVEIKRHFDKALGVVAPDKLFLAWGHQAEMRSPVSVHDIVIFVEEFIDDACALGNQSPADEFLADPVARQGVNDAPLQGKAEPSQDDCRPYAEAVSIPNTPHPDHASREPDETNDRNKISYAIGAQVYACFYGEWHPATIREVNVDSFGSVEVLWHSEVSRSIVPLNLIVPMVRNRQVEDHV